MCLIFQTVRCSSTSIVLRSCVPRGRPDVCTMVAVDTRREVGTGSSNLDPCSSVRMYTQARATTCPACSTRVCLHLLLPLSASLFLRTLHHLTSLPHVIFSHLFFPPPTVTADLLCFAQCSREMCAEGPRPEGSRSL